MRITWYVKEEICVHCGAKILYPIPYDGITPPEPIYSCNCHTEKEKEDKQE